MSALLASLPRAASTPVPLAIFLLLLCAAPAFHGGAAQTLPPAHSFSYSFLQYTTRPLPESDGWAYGDYFNADGGRYTVQYIVNCNLTQSEVQNYYGSSNACKAAPTISMATLASPESLANLATLVRANMPVANTRAFLGGLHAQTYYGSTVPGRYNTTWVWSEGRFTGVPFIDAPGTDHSAHQTFPGQYAPPFVTGQPNDPTTSHFLGYYPLSAEDGVTDLNEVTIVGCMCVACERSACSVKADCGGRAHSVSGDFYPNCVCRCSGGYSGPRCQISPVRRATVTVAADDADNRNYLTQYRLECPATMVQGLRNANTFCTRLPTADDVDMTAVSQATTPATGTWRLATIPDVAANDAIAQLAAPIALWNTGFTANLTYAAASAVIGVAGIVNATALTLAAEWMPGNSPTKGGILGNVPTSSIESSYTNWAGGQTTGLERPAPLADYFLTTVRTHPADPQRGKWSIASRHGALDRVLCVVCERAWCFDGAYTNRNPPQLGANTSGAVRATPFYFRHRARRANHTSPDTGSLFYPGVCPAPTATAPSTASTSRRESRSESYAETATASLDATQSTTVADSLTAPHTQSSSRSGTATHPTAVPAETETATHSPLTSQSRAPLPRTPTASHTLPEAATPTLLVTASRETATPTPTAEAVAALASAGLPQTPAQAVVSASTGAIAAAGGALLAGGAMGQQAVAGALVRMAACASSDHREQAQAEREYRFGESSMSVLAHPLRFSLGAGDSRAMERGAILGNTVLIPLVFAALLYWPVARLCRCLLPEGAPPGEEYLVMGWPSVVVMPYIALAEGTGYAIVRLLTDGDSNKAASVAVGAVGAVLQAAVLVAWLVALWRWVPRARMVLTRNALPMARWVRPIAPVYEWECRAADKEDETGATLLDIGDAGADVELASRHSDDAVNRVCDDDDDDGNSLGDKGAEGEPEFLELELDAGEGEEDGGAGADGGPGAAEGGLLETLLPPSPQPPLLDDDDNHVAAAPVAERKCRVAIARNYSKDGFTAASAATVARASNLFGEKCFLWAEVLCFVCGLAVGVVEGLPGYTTQLCRIRAGLAFCGAVVQAAAILTTVVPLEGVFLGLNSAATVVLAALMLKLVVEQQSTEDSYDTRNALNTVALVGNVLALGLTVIGVLRVASKLRFAHLRRSFAITQGLRRVRQLHLWKEFTKRRREERRARAAAAGAGAGAPNADADIDPGDLRGDGQSCASTAAIAPRNRIALRREAREERRQLREREGFDPADDDDAASVASTAVVAPQNPRGLRHEAQRRLAEEAAAARRPRPPPQPRDRDPLNESTETVATPAADMDEVLQRIFTARENRFLEPAVRGEMVQRFQDAVQRRQTQYFQNHPERRLRLARPRRYDEDYDDFVDQFEAMPEGWQRVFVEVDTIMEARQNAIDRGRYQPRHL